MRLVRYGMRTGPGSQIALTDGDRAGERSSVAEYLAKSAERYRSERERLLTDAAQIRAGVMPLSCQYAEARR